MVRPKKATWKVEYPGGLRRYIDQLPSGQWRARLKHPEVKGFITGMHVTGKAVSHPTEEQAKKWCDAAVEVIIKHGKIEGGRLRIETPAVQHAERKKIHVIAAERFWETPKKKTNSVRTTINQRNQFDNYVAPTLGQFYPEDLDGKIGKVNWEAWVSSLFEMKKVRGGEVFSESLRNSVYHLGASLVRRLVFWGLIKESPIPEDSPVVVPQPKKPERVLEPEDVIKLARSAMKFSTSPTLLPPAASGRDVPFKGVMEGQANFVCMLTMGFCGLRIGETFGLRVEDVDRREGELIIDEQQQVVDGKILGQKIGNRARAQSAVDEERWLEQDPDAVWRVVYKLILKRRNSHRRVPVPPDVMDAIVAFIDEYIGWDDPKMVLFQSRSTYWRDQVFRPAYEDAKIEALTPHDLRHTTATQLYDNDYKVEEIAKILGDAIKTVEDTYIHLFSTRGSHDRMKGFNKRIGAALNGEDKNVINLRRASGEARPRRRSPGGRQPRRGGS